MFFKIFISNIRLPRGRANGKCARWNSTENAKRTVYLEDKEVPCTLNVKNLFQRKIDNKPD
jgi:hypothetical protein